MHHGNSAAAHNKYVQSIKHTCANMLSLRVVSLKIWQSATCCHEKLSNVYPCTHLYRDKTNARLIPSYLCACTLIALLPTCVRARQTTEWPNSSLPANLPPPSQPPRPPTSRRPRARLYATAGHLTQRGRLLSQSQSVLTGSSSYTLGRCRNPARLRSCCVRFGPEAE